MICPICELEANEIIFRDGKLSCDNCLFVESQDIEKVIDFEFDFDSRQSFSDDFYAMVDDFLEGNEE